MVESLVQQQHDSMKSCSIITGKGYYNYGHDKYVILSEESIRNWECIPGTLGVPRNDDSRVPLA